MRPNPAILKRFVTAAAIALPVTIALLMLMTHLILPSEYDPVINRMMMDLELHREEVPFQVLQIPVFKKPPKPERKQVADPSALGANEAIDQQYRTDVAATTAASPPDGEIIDWRDIVSDMVDEMNEEEFTQWLVGQGHETYVSIMQGPLPTTNRGWPELPGTQEDVTGYMNTYGDKEIKISENCVATSQVAGRFDMSDFAKQLPMRITCKTPRKTILTFKRDED